MHFRPQKKANKGNPLVKYRRGLPPLPADAPSREELDEKVLRAKATKKYLENMRKASVRVRNADITTEKPSGLPALPAQEQETPAEQVLAEIARKPTKEDKVLSSLIQPMMVVRDALQAFGTKEVEQILEICDADEREILIASLMID